MVLRRQGLPSYATFRFRSFIQKNKGRKYHQRRLLVDRKIESHSQPIPSFLLSTTGSSSTCLCSLSPFIKSKAMEESGFVGSGLCRQFSTSLNDDFKTKRTTSTAENKKLDETKTDEQLNGTNEEFTGESTEKSNIRKEEKSNEDVKNDPEKATSMDEYYKIQQSLEAERWRQIAKKVRVIALQFDVDEAPRPDLILDIIRENGGSLEWYEAGIVFFSNREGKFRKGAVDFVNMCLEDFDKNNMPIDRRMYNNLLSVFPRRRFHVRSLLDVVWPVYTQHMVLAVKILDRMENEAVCPDLQTLDIIEDVFGKQSGPSRKMHNLMYWFMKYGITPTEEHHVKNTPRIVNPTNRMQESFKAMFSEKALIQFPHPVKTHPKTHVEDPKTLFIDTIKYEKASPQSAESSSEKEDSTTTSTEEINNSEDDNNTIVWCESDKHRQALARLKELHQLVNKDFKEDTKDQTRLNLVVNGPFSHWYDSTELPYYTLHATLSTPITVETSGFIMEEEGVVSDEEKEEILQSKIVSICMFDHHANSRSVKLHTVNIYDPNPQTVNKRNTENPRLHSDLFNINTLVDHSLKEKNDNDDFEDPFNKPLKENDPKSDVNEMERSTEPPVDVTANIPVVNVKEKKAKLDAFVNTWLQLNSDIIADSIVFPTTFIADSRFKPE